MKTNFYGIGVGPGDPDLLTIKAKKIINQVDVLFCPVKGDKQASFAYSIIEPHLENGAVEIVDLVYLMKYKWADIDDQWHKNAKIIEDYLAAGKRCAFITLGDPTVYSTFIYTLERIDKALYKLEIVPGITSFCATAARLGQPLTSWQESLKIVPVRKNDSAHLRAEIASADNLVLMKPSNDAAAIVAAIRELNLENNFMMISKVGTADEQRISDIALLSQMKIPYLSTIIIKKGGFND